MATFTITTAVNIDTLASKVGGDTYNINGGYLTVDQHSRYGTNQNTSAAMGSIALSASLGGTIEFNSTKVRAIPFNLGNGNAPDFDTVISIGGASGKLLGVYLSTNSTPLTPGMAMGSSGYILIRQWNDVPFSAGSLTGIGATATGADRPGWLEIVGVDALTVTVNRLNLFKVRGDYYDFMGETTSGARITQYNLPTNGGVGHYWAGVEVETDVADVYEFYPCAGSATALLATIGTEHFRGRFCWVTVGGTLRFGHDGTNSTGGYCPPAGRKLRVPNIQFACAAAGALTVNKIPHATITSRYDFTTTGGGVIDIDKASFNWYMSFTQSFSVALTDVHTMSSLLLAECAAPIAWTNVNVGHEAALSFAALSMSLNFAGGTLDKCCFSRAHSTGTGTTATDCTGFTFTNMRYPSLVKSTIAVSLTRVKDSSWVAPQIVGSGVSGATCSNVTVTDVEYCDMPASTSLAANARILVQWTSGSVNCTVDGLTLPIAMNAPRTGLMSVESGSSRCKLRNIGTAAAPLDLGGPEVIATWTRSTTTATVTYTDHGLESTATIQLTSSTSVAATPIGTESITRTGPNTFTFACANAGDASGTLTYYPYITGYVLNGLSGASAIKAQRVYCTHMVLSNSSVAADNSIKDVQVDNILSTLDSTQVFTALNGKFRGVQGVYSAAAQSSVYGTHFADLFERGVPANTDELLWTRSATVVTVYINDDHGRRVGDPFNVTVSSAETPVPLGVKTIAAVPSKDTFTFTGVNSGPTIGTLTFVPFNGRLAIYMNEPTVETAGDVTITNGSAFTSVGTIYMPTIGMTAEWTWPWNIIGHTAFPIAEAVMTGGTITNYKITYSIDGGTNYHNLSYARAGATGTSGLGALNMTNTAGVEVGDYVFGTNVAYNTKVTSISNSTQLNVDKANIGTVSGTLRFNHLPSETVADASVGFPLKIKIQTDFTNATAISGLAIYTRNTVASRGYQYPLDIITLTLTGLVAGSDVVILAAGAETVLDSVDSNAGTTWGFNYETPEAIDICVYKSGYIPFFIRNYSLLASAASLPVAQVADLSYLT